jgi:uncharacterized membrane protein YedE/YeeE
MTPFIPALAGGVLIGLAAALLLISNGQIAGISGIVGGLLPPRVGDLSWRLAFLGGLVGGGLLLIAVHPGAFGAPVVHGIAGPITAGLLVGFGTRLGNGCTSGHGVCGIARGSVRSLWATLTFTAFAALTVFVWRHLLGVSP